jgi:hypothetical protein
MNLVPFLPATDSRAAVQAAIDPLGQWPCVDQRAAETKCS